MLIGLLKFDERLVWWRIYSVCYALKVIYAFLFCMPGMYFMCLKDQFVQKMHQNFKGNGEAYGYFHWCFVFYWCYTLVGLLYFLELLCWWLIFVKHLMAATGEPVFFFVSLYCCLYYSEFD